MDLLRGRIEIVVYVLQINIMIQQAIVVNLVIHQIDILVLHDQYENSLVKDGVNEQSMQI